MAGVSGQYGTVKIGTAPGTTVASEVNHWSVNENANVKAAASAETPSAGGDGYSRVKGRRNDTGSMKGLYDPDAPPTFAAGDTVVLNLYPAPLKYYTCSAMIATFGVDDVDIENGDVMTWSATFEINGVLGALQTVTP